MICLGLFVWWEFFFHFFCYFFIVVQRGGSRLEEDVYYCCFCMGDLEKVGFPEVAFQGMIIILHASFLSWLSIRKMSYTHLKQVFIYVVPLFLFLIPIIFTQVFLQRIYNSRAPLL